MSIVSKSVQQIVPLMISRIDPPTEFEKKRKSLKLVDLKMMCKDAHLHTSGNKGILIERLEHHDSRCVYSGLRKSLIQETKYTYDRHISSNEYDAILNGSYNKRRELLKQSLQIYGSVDNIKKYMQSVMNGKETRRNQLITALKERNCVLRSDSVLCNDFINGKGNSSLDLVVDTSSVLNTSFRQFVIDWNCNGVIQYDTHLYLSSK